MFQSCRNVCLVQDQVLKVELYKLLNTEKNGTTSEWSWLFCSNKHPGGTKIQNTPARCLSLPSFPEMKFWCRLHQAQPWLWKKWGKVWHKQTFILLILHSGCSTWWSWSSVTLNKSEYRRKALAKHDHFLKLFPVLTVKLSLADSDNDDGHGEFSCLSWTQRNSQRLNADWNESKLQITCVIFVTVEYSTSLS